MAQDTSSGMFLDDEFYCISGMMVEDGIDTINCNSSDQICGMLLTDDDSKYAEELQLQEAITASLITNFSTQEEEQEGESSTKATSTKEIGESSLTKNDSNQEEEQEEESSMKATTSTKEIEESTHSKNNTSQEEGKEGESSMIETSTKEIGESSPTENDSTQEQESSMKAITSTKEIDESTLSKNNTSQEEEKEGESSMMETSTKETSESSHHSVCAICVEDRENDEMVRIQNCSHSFCTECVTKHVTVKIEEKNVKGEVFVRCPGLDCEGNIELDTCKTLIPKEVFDRWNEALVESMIEVSQKFYCPFKDCSALLVNDSGEDGAVIRACECPECNRLFCAQCYVPWHSDVDCDELQRLSADEKGNEDRMVRQLAKEKSWMRCPTCKFYVEKTQGCLHMTCRCGCQFCYACGQLWSNTHGGCRP